MDKLKQESERQLSMCCQTLCVKKDVLAYIAALEAEIIKIKGIK